LGAEQGEEEGFKTTDLRHLQQEFRQSATLSTTSRQKPLESNRWKWSRWDEDRTDGRTNASRRRRLAVVATCINAVFTSTGPYTRPDQRWQIRDVRPTVRFCKPRQAAGGAGLGPRKPQQVTSFRKPSVHCTFTH
jgi:hypothetical protein